jgi:hypothetical protein
VGAALQGPRLFVWNGPLAEARVDEDQLVRAHRSGPLADLGTFGRLQKIAHGFNTT